MTLMELLQVKAPTYVELVLDEDSKKALEAIAKLVPNPCESDELHTTLIYSTKPITFKARGKLDPPITAKVKHYSIFDTQTGEKCLVLELDCPEMVARHKEIMEETGASYQFDEYKPHVTVSYDCGDFDISKLPPCEDLAPLTFIAEQSEPIDEDWA